MRIAFASGKGGVGKTTLAVNTAYTLGVLGERCMFVDCDVEEPNGHLYLPVDFEEQKDVTVKVPRSIQGKCDGCGECQKACQFKAILALEKSVMVFDELCHSCGTCLLACPKDALEEKDRHIGRFRRGKAKEIEFMDAELNIGEARATPLITELRKQEQEWLKSYPDAVVVADAPPGATCPTMEAIKESDYLVLVTEPTPFGLHDLEVVHGLSKELSLRVGVVVNRSDLGDDRIAEYCMENDLDLVGSIPYDTALAEAGAHGDVIVSKDSSAAGLVAGVVRAVLNKAERR